jgi:hypothetical protein
VGFAGGLGTEPGRSLNTEANEGNEELIKLNRERNNMAISKEELQERAQLVRLVEAACRIDFPTPDELNYRISLMKRVGVTFQLREMRQVSIAGPATPDNTKPRPLASASAEPSTPLRKGVK